MGSLLQQRWSLFHSTTATKRRTAKWLVSLMLLSGLHKIFVNKITFVDFCGAIAPVTTPRMYLIIFIHIIQCTDWYETTVDKRAFSSLKNRFLDLKVANFENASSHKNIVQMANTLWMARSEMTAYIFLVLIQKSQTLFWKFQLQTFVV